MIADQNSRLAAPLTVPEPTISAFIFRSLSIILSNIVPIYGVIHLGWDSAGLIILFVLEAILVLLSDTIKFHFIKKKN